MIKKAFENSEAVKALTFHPHPLQVLKTETAPARLFDYEDQWQQLHQHGVSEIEAVPFTAEFAQLSGREFFTSYIARPNVRHVVIGENFRFGCDRTADWRDLQSWGKDLGIGVTGVSPLEVDGEVVSSSKIRQCLAQAQISQAAKLLGRSYSVSGHVVSGEKRGRQIGFPTANLQLAPEMKNRLALQAGVYYGQDGKGRKFVMNVGQNPTVSKTAELKIEAHFLNFSEDLYGERLQLSLFGFLRPEKRFAGLDSLREQIQKDIDEANTRMKS